MYAIWGFEKVWADALTSLKMRHVVPIKNPACAGFRFYFLILIRCRIPSTVPVTTYIPEGSC